MNIEVLPHKKIFVYDLEFIGDVNDILSCKIWDIAFLCVETGERISSIVEPDITMNHIPPPIVDGLFPLTREFLNEHCALPFYTVWNRILKWILNRSKNSNVVLVSHNNFSSDKLVFENHMKKYNCFIPHYIYFFDSLLFFRDNIKTHDYSLKGLVKLILNKDHTNAHRADIDTIRLYKCIKHINIPLKGYVFPLYSNSLRTIKGIGSSAENILIQHNIVSKEQLFENIYNMGYDILYTCFLNTNISVKNIEIIKHSIFNQIYGVKSIL